MFTVEYCKTKAGFEVKPLKKTLINFDTLSRKGKILISTPHVCLLLIDSLEVIVHKHGLINFKEKVTKEQARKIGLIIYSL